jgi:DNA-binding transcriptional ArsR family regulator
VLRTLAGARRRHALAVLLDRSAPVAEGDLVTCVAAAEQGTPLVEVTREETRAVRADLRHVHLPALADAGLVEYDADDGTAAATSHPALRDSWLRRIIETDADGWDGVLDCLADDRRRVVLTVLEAHGEPMPRRDLAQAVADREFTPDQPVDAEDVLCSLHHVHLPKLEAAGLVECDDIAETVAYRGHPGVDVAWFDFAADETSRAVVPDAEHADDIWTIPGRSNVLARGQSLIRHADDEVFLVFTTDGLLEEECFRVIEDAVERGVDLGSQTRAVRDRVRERAPEVTIWEPQLDWLNLPPNRERLGRLVFVDREAVMLGTLGEPNADGVHSETAITGDGPTNGLVVMLRELLGSRLDHLDAQSEDALAQMPL